MAPKFIYLYIFLVRSSTEQGAMDIEMDKNISSACQLSRSRADLYSCFFHCLVGSSSSNRFNFIIISLSASQCACILYRYNKANILALKESTF